MSLGRTLGPGWEDKALAGIADGYDYNGRALNEVASMLCSLSEHLERHGVTRWRDVRGDLTLEWCWSEVRRPDGSAGEPARDTARFRQWVARAAFTAVARLGAEIDPHIAAGERIERSDPDVSARPLTDQQMQAVCDTAASATARSKQPVRVALSLAGGSAAEVAAVRARDVDLDARTVAFAGSGARVCALDEWSARAIARYLAANHTVPDERLCVRADTPHESAAHSVSIQLWTLLKSAEFASRRGVSAGSIRLTAARRVLERDGIAAAARFLGSPSLDSTAEVLGYRWRPHSSAAALAGAEDSACG